jgi:uncharacterized protein YndB with AHSA1/START domain
MGTTKITADPGVPFIDFVREFDAPRDLVFRAHTDPDLLAQWLGPAKYKMTVERLEVRDGGTWRYINSGPDGAEYGFHGVFHGTPSPDNMVQTFEFEGAPGHVSLDSLTLEEKHGKTLARGRSVFQSVEDRDAMFQGGMADGMNEGYTRLDELLARLAAPVR